MIGPITFSVLGTPVAKARARVTCNGNYTPAKTRGYENSIAWRAREAMVGTEPHHGPMRLIVAAEFPVPTTWPKWKQQAALLGEVAHTTRPDGDNIVKAVKDALRGVVWRDDCQVTHTEVIKRYSRQPKLVATVEPIRRLAAQATRRPAA